jgi:PST family polysaccharide transporter
LNDHHKSSYTQILKSSAIVGGAQGIELLIRMVRIKLVAILLGPSGVGLIGLYQSIIEFAGKLSGLGIRSSAVRQVAEANGSGDFERLGQTVKVLRHTCWITGFAGWILMLSLAQPLSIWTFGSDEHAWALAILGAVLLLDNISGGQSALVQGVRRINDLARIMIFSAMGSTLISVILYAWLGERGVVAALLASAAITLTFSWWFSSQVAAPAKVMKWLEIAREARPLLSLGLAFMWSGIITAGVAFATRGLIIRGFGIDASGIYQAAWGISGLFAGFVLSAMGQDFYPRLTAVAHQNNYVNQLVNEQTEVGILLALPGLLATLAFSPWVIQIFYTAKFLTAADMLPWFVLGILGRVISWPVGFIQLAKGSSIIFAATETAANALHLFFIWVGLQYLGIVGVAVAFALLYACHSAVVFLVAVRLSDFRWSISVMKLICYSALFIVVEFGILKLLTGLVAVIASMVLVLVSGIYCLRQLILRLGPEHRISKLAAVIPLVGRYFKV